MVIGVEVEGCARRPHKRAAPSAGRGAGLAARGAQWHAACRSERHGAQAFTLDAPRAAAVTRAFVALHERGLIYRCALRERSRSLAAAERG